MDNLKLGYGGTQAEMERLLEDAQAITGEKYNLSNFADVVEAIHVIQDEMGIAGTTAKEASSTIQGSAMAMKGAWTNFIGGMANEDADFDQLFDNLVDSVLTFMDNLIPRIQKMLPRLVRGLTEIAKSLGAYLPDILAELIPELAKGVRDLLGSLWDVLVECGPMLKQMGLDLIKYLYEGFTGKEMDDGTFAVIEDKLNDVLKAIGDIVSGCADFGRQLMDVLGPALIWIGDVALKAFVWIGDNIEWILPVLGSLLGAMLAFKAVKSVVGVVQGFMGLFGGGSGAGGAAGGASGGGGFFGSLANLKPATILKGIGNLALILGALGALAAVFMWVSPYLAELSDWKSITEVLIVMSALGLVGSAMAKLAGSVGNIPVGTVAKGLANMAIVLVGLGALTAVFVWVAPHINAMGNLGDTLKLLVVIGVVGLVGSALAALAGVIGMIPIAAVLTGLANIALALAGFTAVVAAYGALAMIPGFNDFMTNGGEVLANLCRILGEMVGSLIGGLGEGITNSLPAIGENLSAFAASLQPMFETFSGVDSEGLKSFAVALAALIGVLAGERLVSIITGGINYEELGTNLNSMASGLSGFFTTIMSFPDGGFEKAAALFNCLANISSLPKEGGVVGWFKGEVNFENMAAGLNQLAGTAGFFTAVQAIPEEAFTKAKQLFDCLAGIKALPQDGGVVGWFKGEVNFENIATGLQTLASDGMIAALTAISKIPAESFTSLSAMFEALAGIKNMPEDGGIAQWFTGDSTTTLTSVASQLPGVATNIAAFFSNLGGRTDFTPIKTLFETLGNIEIGTDAAEGTGLFGLGASAMETMGTGLSNFATNAATFFDAINTMDIDAMITFFDEIATVGDLPEAVASIDEDIATALSNLNTTAETKFGVIKTTVSNGVTDIVDVVNGASLYNAGVALMNGLNSGILSKKTTLLATARSIASSISSTIDDALDINSPSKVTFKSGAYTGEGVDLGMQSMIPKIESTADKMGRAAIPYSGSYSPDTDGGSVYNNGGNSEYTTISPVFNLTISGSQDDRTLARKVKRYVSEAMNDAFESLDYAATTVVREV